jgi:hypothetical protein
MSGFLLLPIKKLCFFIGLYFNFVGILAKEKRFYNKARESSSNPCFAGINTNLLVIDKICVVNEL